MSVDCACEKDIEPISFCQRFLKGNLDFGQRSDRCTLKFSSDGLACIGLL